MKLQELRCGNKVLYYVGTERKEWGETSVDTQDLCWLNGNPESFNKVHKPMPLTAEKLVEMGFEENNWIDDGGVPIYFGYNKGDFQVDNIDGKLFYNRDTPLEYVHQLQNIIYDLTGEEI